MNELSFTCPKCRAQLALDKTHAGSNAICPNCAESLVIPRLAPTNETRPVDKTITFRLGFAGKNLKETEKPKKREVERPSRKLIYALVGAWSVLSIASIVIGIFIGVEIRHNYNNTAASAHQEDFSSLPWAPPLPHSYATSGSNTQGYRFLPPLDPPTPQQLDTLPVPQTHTPGNILPDLTDETLALTLKNSFDAGRKEGRESALSELRKINISTGTMAAQVAKLLGTPDAVVSYDMEKLGAHFVYPSWSYGSVRIYFDGDYDFNVVVKWSGDLKGLLDEKLKRN